MNGRGRLGAAGLLVALGLVLAGAVSAQVRPDRGGPAPRPATPAGVPTPKKPDAPVRGGQICAVAYEDRNANGRRDGGEGPLIGQSFTVTNAAGAQLAQGASGGDGRFCTPRPLPFGDYRVRLIPGGGLTNTDPGGASLNAKSVSLRTEGAVTVLFGSCRGEGCSGGAGGASSKKLGGPGTPTPQSMGRVCVTKYNDLNADGARQGEPWLPGWTFNVYNANGGGVATLTTDNYGQACSQFILVPGAYTIAEVLPAGGGWLNTDPGGSAVKAFSVIATGTANVTFGNVRLGRVCVRKYNDVNGNGVWNSPEPMLGGVTFVVYDSIGTNVAQGVTDGIGLYCTPYILTAGNYKVTENTPPGWVITQPATSISVNFSITMPGLPPVVWFGNREIRPEICVEKYEDQDGSGTRNGTDPMLAGWTFTRSGGGMPTESGVTGANGRWCSATLLPPGTYTITETMKPGWVSTDPGGSSPVKMAVIVSNQMATVQFGNRQAGKVCARKYDDLNNNGSRQANEPFMPGVVFTVTGADGVVASGMTDTMGNYCTPTTLVAGTYTIAETVPGGWTNTQPGGAAYVSVAVTTPQDVPPLAWFGNHKPVPPLPGELCVEKYNDLNGDGDQDPGEGPLQGWTFTRSGGGMPSLSGSTGANGRWCPGTLLPPGTYTVTETMKSGWTSKDPGGLTPVKTAVVVTNQTTIVKFGNQQDPLPGEICVRKYKDVNNNGSFDSGEPPLSGWQFTVRNASNTIVGVGSTGGAGQWCTPMLIPPGTYTVTETPQAGWTNTDPGGSTPVKTVVVGSNAAPTVWFGNRQP